MQCDGGVQKRDMQNWMLVGICGDVRRRALIRGRKNCRATDPTLCCNGQISPPPPPYQLQILMRSDGLGDKISIAR